MASPPGRACLEGPQRQRRALPSALFRSGGYSHAASSATRQRGHQIPVRPAELKASVFQEANSNLELARSISAAACVFQEAKRQCSLARSISAAARLPHADPQRDKPQCDLSSAIPSCCQLPPARRGSQVSQSNRCFRFLDFESVERSEIPQATSAPPHPHPGVVAKTQRPGGRDKIAGDCLGRGAPAIRFR